MSSVNPPVRVGVIGLGLMGKPMARNLVKAGVEVTVHNRRRAAVDELAAAGARAASSPREVGPNLPVTTAVERMFTTLVEDRGNGHLDNSAVMTIVESLAAREGREGSA